MAPDGTERDPEPTARPGDKTKIGSTRAANPPVPATNPGVDATLVRCILVPAFMTWQRRIMWWAPRWMKRLHARYGLRD